MPFTLPVRRLFILACSLLFVSVALQAQGKKPLTFEQVFKNAEPRITTSLPMVLGWADESHYLETKGYDGVVTSVNAADGKETVYRDLSQYKDVADSGIALNFPSSHTADYGVVVYLKDKDIYILNTKARTFKRLTDTREEEKNATVSPDGNYVAFTRENDLYAIDVASGKESRYTDDGSDVVYNGWASWVYYEEIFGRPSQYRAFWWSPDSRHLAFYRFDDSRVPMFPIFNADSVHGSLEKTRYPEPGDPNPEVRVGFVTVAGGKVQWADFDPADDQYFGTPFWTPNGKQLFVQWMNRGQDDLKIYAVDPATGKRREIYDEKQESWVEWFENIYFLRNGSGFILMSDKNGWMHLYLHAMDGSFKNSITTGEWAVTGLETVDETNGVVYFTARKENSTRSDLYRIALDGRDMKRLTFGDFFHAVKVSPGGARFVTTYSNSTTPPRMALCDNNGKVIRDIADSKTAAFDDYDLAKTEILRVTTADGYALPVEWTLPIGFDPAKKYPVLIAIYGGPNAGTVYDRWGGTSGQWLSREGVIQVAIDHRGSGHFGKKGVALMHRNLGKWEMHDYIEVVKWLRTKPFVDSTRVCITGGSYGGYVTCMALTAGAGYFTHGIADFSVTDWHLYDSHYTERYMDSPQENPEGYRDGSVMTHASQYKGVLRIVHGTLDDNVHMQNSIQLIDKLETLGKHFELMLYPGGRHGWGGPKAAHLRSETYRFYYQYLIDKPFPEELFAQPGMERRGMRR